METETISSKEAAYMTGYHSNTVWKVMTRGQLPATYEPKHRGYRVRVRDVVIGWQSQEKART